MNTDEPWWRGLYDELLAEVLLVRGDQTEVDQTVDFLADVLDLKTGARIFDQCCGIGSLSLPLARRGLEVVGVDLGEGYAARGQSAASAEGLAVELRAGDAFDFVPDAPCDAAFNWWTSFGYAETDAQNLRMLERAHDALAPGGRFALDTMNLPGVLARFEPAVVTVRDTPLGRIQLTRASRYDAATGVMHKVWTYDLGGGRRVRRESSVRAYTPPELVRLSSEVGFEEVRLVGSIRGEPLSTESPRCIVIARRPR